MNYGREESSFLLFKKRSLNYYEDRVHSVAGEFRVKALRLDLRLGLS